MSRTGRWTTETVPGRAISALKKGIGAIGSKGMAMSTINNGSTGFYGPSREVAPPEAPRVTNLIPFKADTTQTDTCPSCGEPYGNGCMPPEMIASNTPAAERAGLCRQDMKLIDSVYDFAARLRSGSMPSQENGS